MALRYEAEENFASILAHLMQAEFEAAYIASHTLIFKLHLVLTGQPGKQTRKIPSTSSLTIIVALARLRLGTRTFLLRFIKLRMTTQELEWRFRTFFMWTSGKKVVKGTRDCDIHYPLRLTSTTRRTSLSLAVDALLLSLVHLVLTNSHGNLTE